MGKKIKVRRSSPDPKPATPASEVVLVEEWPLADGTTAVVGDLLLVNHISFGGRWHELELKRITVFGDAPSFHFYSSPPGAISVGIERVKGVKKKIKIRKTKEQ